MSRKRQDWVYDPHYPSERKHDKLSQRRESEPPSVFGSLIWGFFLGLFCPFVGYIVPAILFPTELFTPLFLICNVGILFLLYMLPHPSVRIPFFGAFIFTVILRDAFFLSLIQAEIELYYMLH